jgi:lipooligosaccharide transport system permease protein
MSSNLNFQRTRIGAAKLVNPRDTMRFGAFYIAEYRIRNMMRWWFSMSTGSILNPFFYLAALGLGVGKYIDATNHHGIQGVSYLKFIAPALIASVAINDFNAEVSFPVLSGFKWEKTFFAMNSTPLTGGQIAMGAWLAGLARVALSSAIYFLILLFFGGATISAWPIYLTAIFAGAAFSAMVLYAAAAIKNDDFFLNILGRVIVMPLFLFSGTFYPLSSSPKALQLIGWISPLWHAAQLGRHFSYGANLSAQMIVTHLLYLCSWIVIGLSLAIKTFNRRLAQ